MTTERTRRTGRKCGQDHRVPALLGRQPVQTVAEGDDLVGYRFGVSGS
jgi:hypothetical protein